MMFMSKLIFYIFLFFGVESSELQQTKFSGTRLNNKFSTTLKEENCSFF